MNNHSLGPIGIVGNGSWGTALAKILTDNGNNIYWWVRNADSVTYLQKRHHNPHYLTSVRFLSDTINPTSNLEELLQVELEVTQDFEQNLLECSWDSDTMAVDRIKFDQVNLLIAVMKLGLNEMAKQYPESLRLSEVEV